MLEISSLFKSRKLPDAMHLPFKLGKLGDALSDDDSSSSRNNGILHPELLLKVDASSLIAMGFSLVWDSVASAAFCEVELLIDKLMLLPDQLDEIAEALLNELSPSHNDGMLHELDEVLLDEPSMLHLASVSSLVWRSDSFFGVSETIFSCLTQPHLFL